jgi:hypothetical protein
MTTDTDTDPTIPTPDNNQARPTRAPRRRRILTTGTLAAF